MRGWGCAVLHTNRAASLLAAGKAEEARAACDAALQTAPALVRAWERLAAVCVARGEAEAAAKALDVVLALHVARAPS